MAAPRIIEVESSPLFLSEDGPLRRRPKWTLRSRSERFHAAFEHRALYYDAFWHVDGERVLLVGPPPFNLRRILDRATFVALPSGTLLSPQTFASLSAAVTAMAAPPDTRTVRIELGGEGHELAVQPNLSDAFAGCRILTTINRDNELAWIAEWADYYARQHAADAVIVFDNGSTRYTCAELEKTLASVSALKLVAVPSWPWKFGPVDPAVLMNPYWASFLHIAALSVALRRFAARAFGLLNVDIDELVKPGTESVFDAAAASAHGLVRMPGQWIAPTPAVDSPEHNRTHRHYPYRYETGFGPSAPAGKWALDPTRSWVADLGVHPYWHWIEGRPMAARAWSREFAFWHFRAINTGWKEERAVDSDTLHLELDPDLAAAWR